MPYYIILHATGKWMKRKRDIKILDAVGMWFWRSMEKSTWNPSSRPTRQSLFIIYLSEDNIVDVSFYFMFIDSNAKINQWLNVVVWSVAEGTVNRALPVIAQAWLHHWNGHKELKERTKKRMEWRWYRRTCNLQSTWRKKSKMKKRIWTILPIQWHYQKFF